MAYYIRYFYMDKALVGVPEHLRMGYKILKNAGVLPEEMQLKKEMVSLKTLLDASNSR